MAWAEWGPPQHAAARRKTGGCTSDCRPTLYWDWYALAHNRRDSGYAKVRTPPTGSSSRVATWRILAVLGFGATSSATIQSCPTVSARLVSTMNYEFPALDVLFPRPVDRKVGAPCRLLVHRSPVGRHRDVLRLLHGPGAFGSVIRAPVTRDIGEGIGGPSSCEGVVVDPLTKPQHDRPPARRFVHRGCDIHPGLPRSHLRGAIMNTCVEMTCAPN